MIYLSFEQMASGAGTHGSGSGSRARRHRTTSQQHVLALPPSQGSTAGSTSTVGMYFNYSHFFINIVI
jgi:hypothetical protein